MTGAGEFGKAGGANGPDRIEYSFEFFPPKTPGMEAQLWRAVSTLAPLSPRFVSVTYGAGGGTRERTHSTIERILRETDLVPAAHLTCVGASRGEVDTVAHDYRDAGVRHIVALRGDPPQGAGRFRPHPDGYGSAAELVAGLRRIADFEISVAAYPEAHPESRSAEADLDNLKRKLDAGASSAITQFFFDPDIYLRFVERARRAGIDAPIAPGILPITNFGRARAFAASCGASIPDWFARRFEGLGDDHETRGLVAAATAVEQCHYLRARGVNGFHFYTLNRAELTTAICRMMRAPTARAA